LEGGGVLLRSLATGNREKLIAKNQNTIEKRRREMEKKRKAEAKRERRRRKKEQAAAPAEADAADNSENDFFGR